MERLQKNIDYSFNNIDLLKQALTHRSVGKQNNERLEFLGDSVLGSIISRELYQRFPSIDEGQLSRLRSHMVRGQTLAKLAKQINLSEQLILGQGELKSGGFRRESIQADAFEAVLGAIFLDSDYLTVNKVILKLYKELLDEANPDDSHKDFKTQLQEALQKRGSDLPQYDLIKTSGKDHNAVFYVRCSLTNENIKVEKSSKSIKRAEQACAEVILEKLSIL
jgi:ribonuclease-3|tara:strand:- start:50 stop:715 length:666 start_codon:yes stop_codon:yes gene_type:complete